MNILDAMVSLTLVSAGSEAAVVLAHWFLSFHLCGCAASISRSMSTATVADSGPLTSFHLFFVLERALKVRFHITVRETFCSADALPHILIHERNCSSGILTLGSAVSLDVFDLLKDHLIAAVEQAPALMHPVATAMLALHLSTFDGAIPTAVWPYFWDGATPVSASRFALRFLLARMPVRHALFFTSTVRAFCLATDRWLAADVSTPMSMPWSAVFIGIWFADAARAKAFVSELEGTAMLFSDISSFK